MRAFILAALVLLAPLAHAEAPVLTARSRVEGSHLALLLAPNGLGVGIQRSSPTRGAGAYGLAAELLYLPATGTVELRHAHQLQLAGGGLFALSLAAGVSGYGVFRGPVNVGAGPVLGVFAGLGGTQWEVLLGAQGGAEYFLATGGPRFPVRGVLGAQGRVGEWGVSLTARAGADLEPGRYATLRGDAVLAVSWYGLGD
jgi:hypothetical protein